MFTGYSELRNSHEDHHRDTVDDWAGGGGGGGTGGWGGGGEGEGAGRSCCWLFRAMFFL